MSYVLKMGIFTVYFIHHRCLSYTKAYFGVFFVTAIKLLLEILLLSNFGTEY